ncbi:hypothetical protein CTZ27_20880 [Streptomyces griseocarneus]|nr:hypothetical protein CTZ27_20880 [Streptomyces griseocarneus]
MSEYLNSGHPLLDVMETTVDVLAGSFHVPGGSSVLTDGEFVWRADLPSYVEEYLIWLPPEFLAFAAENLFKAPDVAHEKLLDVSASVSELLTFRSVPGSGPRR